MGRFDYLLDGRSTPKKTEPPKGRFDYLTRDLTPAEQPAAAPEPVASPVAPPVSPQAPTPPPASVPATADTDVSVVFSGPLVDEDIAARADAVLSGQPIDQLSSRQVEYRGFVNQIQRAARNANFSLSAGRNRAIAAISDAIGLPDAVSEFLLREAQTYRNQVDTRETVGSPVLSFIADAIGSGGQQIFSGLTMSAIVPGAGAGDMFLSTAGNSFERFQNEGDDQSEALVKSLFVGGFEAAIEQLQLGRIFKGTSGAQFLDTLSQKGIAAAARQAPQLASRTAKAAGENFLQEAIQEDLPEWLSTQPEDVQQRITNALKAGLGGAIVGPAASLAIGSGQTVDQMPQGRDTEQLRQAAQPQPTVDVETEFNERVQARQQARPDVVDQITGPPLFDDLPSRGRGTETLRQAAQPQSTVDVQAEFNEQVKARQEAKRPQLINKHIALYQRYEREGDSDVAAQIYDIIAQVNNMDGVQDPADGRPFVPPELSQQNVARANELQAQETQPDAVQPDVAQQETGPQTAVQEPTEQVSESTEIATEQVQEQQDAEAETETQAQAKTTPEQTQVLTVGDGITPDEKFTTVFHGSTHLLEPGDRVERDEQPWLSTSPKRDHAQKFGEVITEIRIPTRMIAQTEDVERIDSNLKSELESPTNEDFFEALQEEGFVAFVEITEADEIAILPDIELGDISRSQDTITVHRMPDGTIMEGPEHEGADPGSETRMTRGDFEQAKLQEQQDATGTTETTSARQEQVAEDRESLGLPRVPSKPSETFEQWRQEAIDQGIPDRAFRIASEVNDNPRSMSQQETAGLVHRMAGLKNEHRELSTRVRESQDPAETAGFSAEVNRIEEEFEIISRAVALSGRKEGQALVARKLTLNQDFDLVSVLTRAKVAKGKELTPQERQKFEEMDKAFIEATERITALESQITKIKAQAAIKRGRSTEVARLGKAERSERLTDLVKRTNELLKAGCYE